MMVFTIPHMRLVSEANAREHWGDKARRAKVQRFLGQFYLTDAKVQGQELPPPPWRVTITRIGPRKLDSDNCAGAAKALRDGIADALRVNDGDEAAVTWEYRQEPGAYGVRVEVSGRG